ncbi:MAG: PAS domain S-box protein [Chloroflexi bacterium]|nr:PAS domain S-box protein [Chloroflexota bacterium]
MRSKSTKTAELDFKKILDAAPNSLLIVNAQGAIRYANARAVRMFGYSARELRGKPVELLIPSRFNEHRQLREAYQKAPHERAMGIGLKLAARRKDRSEFPVEVSLNPIRFGRDIYVVAAIQDISSTKQTEIELQKSLIRYHYLLDNMLEGCQIIDFDWRYIYLNDIAAQQGRRKSEEMLMRTMMEMYPGIEDTALFAALQTCMQQRISIKLENQFIYPDGSTAWFDLRIEPVPEGIFILSIDITDRKQAEELLRRSENRYRTLFVDSPISLWEEDFSEVKRRIDLLRRQGVTDFKAYLSAHPELISEWARLVRVVDVNRSAVELYQAGSKENLLANLETILEKNIAETFQDELIAIAEGKTYYSRETTDLTLTGRRINVQITWSAAPNFEDDLSKVIVAIADITERKQAEEALKARTEELRALYELSSALAETDNLETILDLVNHQAVINVHVTFSRIALLEGNDLVIRSAYPIRPLDHSLMLGSRVSLNLLPTCRRILGQGEPVVLKVEDSQVEGLEREMLLFPFIKSTCLIPLRVGGASSDGQVTLGMLILGEARDENREPFTQPKILLAESIGDQAATAIRRMLLHEQTRGQLHTLRALHEIDNIITSTTDIRTSLRAVIPHVMERLHVDAANVWLFNRASGSFTYGYGRGFRVEIARVPGESPLSESLTGRVVVENRMIHFPNLAAAANENPRVTRLVTEEGFVSYFGVPMVAQGRIVGVFQAFHRSQLTPDEDWLELLQTFAGQVAIAIDTASLFNDLERSNMELTLAYESTLEGWSAALDLRDKETEGHTQRVTSMALELARAIGMTEQELVNVRRGALLHDIGKMGVPDHILLKAGPLTDDEWAVMRKHPIYAFELMTKIAYLRDAIEIPYCHHEKWDGTGYPIGLKGREIPLAARVFAVADIYDAVTSDRPYRKAWSRQQALDYIREQSGSHLDPDVVRVFLKMMEDSVQG